MPQINDDSINSIINLEIVNYNIPVSTQLKDGLMSSVDYVKLNSIVYPYPTSTIRGEDCGSIVGNPIRFTKGNIDLYGSEYVTVEGSVELRNISDTGDVVSENSNFHIHTHTFGYDFKIDTNSLFSDLESAGKIVIQGKTGNKGSKGQRGTKGKDRVLSGPQGDKGDDGRALPCSLTSQPETIENSVKQGMSQVIVGAYIKEDPLNAKKYKLVFVRKYAGVKGMEADKLKVNGSNSNWLLVSNRNNGVTDIFFIDIEPILNSMKEQYQRRAEFIKSTYEQKVEKWTQAMSDMFDQQKAALCCALKYCLSSKQNIETRRHIETIAATALPDKVIDFCSKSSDDAIFVNSQSTCNETNNSECDKTKEIDCEPIETQKLSHIDNIYEVSASNNNSINSISIDLSPGIYNIVITDTTIKTGEYYFPSIKIKSGSVTTSFMDKGQYSEEKFAKESYVGLNTTIDHAGGYVNLWNDSGMHASSGSASLSVTKVGETSNVLLKVFEYSSDELVSIINNSSDNKSVLVKIGSQDYLISQLLASNKYYKELVLNGVNPYIMIPIVDNEPVFVTKYSVDTDIHKTVDMLMFRGEYQLVGTDIPRFQSCLIPNAN